jgi:polysaccharide biosynthesis protein PslH
VRALAGNGVEVTGTVADLSPLYERAGVVVVPLRYGGGTRIKILEALAYGRPVVTTAAGAAGLAVTHEQHVLVADDPAAMAAAVARLGSDPALVSRLAVNGRRLVEERHSWPGLETKFAALLQGLARPAT